MGLEKKDENEYNYKDDYIKEAVLLESKIKNLFAGIAAIFPAKTASFQLMSDHDFIHRRDRMENDIHLFF